MQDFKRPDLQDLLNKLNLRPVASTDEATDQNQDKAQASPEALGQVPGQAKELEALDKLYVYGPLTYADKLTRQSFLTLGLFYHFLALLRIGLLKKWLTPLKVRLTDSNKAREEALKLAKRLEANGYKVYAWTCYMVKVQAYAVYLIDYTQDKAKLETALNMQCEYEKRQNLEILLRKAYGNNPLAVAFNLTPLIEEAKNGSFKAYALLTALSVNFVIGELNRLKG